MRCARILRRQQGVERLLRDLELGLAGLGRRERALQRRARDGERARGERAGMPLAPGEQLEREADRGQRPDRGDRAPHRARSARRDAAAPTAPSRSGATRCDPQRSCSLAVVAASTPLLVAGDGLVLGAVVAHEIAAAQRHERGHDPDQRRGELAAEAPAPAHDRRQRGADERRRRPRCRARTRGARRAGSRRITGSATNISAMRTMPRANGTRSAAWVRGRVPLATWMPPSAVAHRRRPGRGAEQRQPVAQGHPAEAELFVAHAVTDPIRSMQCTKARTASSRSRTSMRSSGA